VPNYIKYNYWCDCLTISSACCSMFAIDRWQKSYQI
jgi:hypothetical protein